MQRKTCTKLFTFFKKHVHQQLPGNAKIAWLYHFLILYRATCTKLFDLYKKIFTSILVHQYKNRLIVLEINFVQVYRNQVRKICASLQTVCIRHNAKLLKLFVLCLLAWLSQILQLIISFIHNWSWACFII